MASTCSSSTELECNIKIVSAKDKNASCGWYLQQKCSRSSFVSFLNKDMAKCSTGMTVQETAA